MRDDTKKLLRLSALTALSVLSLYAACVLPTGNVGFVALSSLCGVFAALERGYGGAALMFLASGLLGFFLLPDKGILAFYLCFFGWYPLLKAAAERLKKPGFVWLVKLLGFNVGLGALLLVTRFLVTTAAEIIFTWPVLAVLLNGVFVVYDLGVTQCIGVYRRRVLSHVK